METKEFMQSSVGIVLLMYLIETLAEQTTFIYYAQITEGIVIGIITMLLTSESVIDYFKRRLTAPD